MGSVLKKFNYECDREKKESKNVAVSGKRRFTIFLIKTFSEKLRI